MYPAICRCDDQAFNDMSEESEKKIECFIVKKPLRPVPSRGIFKQAKENGSLTTQSCDSGLTKMARHHLGEAFLGFCNEHPRKYLQKGC